MTIEKVKQIAREKYGKDLTDEQAAKYAEKYGKLSDDELGSVSGGCDILDNDRVCPQCGAEMTRNTKTLEWDCGSCGYQEKPTFGYGIQ